MKHKRLLFLLVIGFCLVGFKSVTLNRPYKNTFHLQGRWKITSLYLNNKRVAINKSPNCEDKENIVFKDSVAQWETYVFRKDRCFKDIWKGTYKLFIKYDYTQNKPLDMLEAGRQYTFVVLELNDSVLKLKEPHQNLIKCFKKIKDH